MHHITLLRCITLLLPLHCIAALRHITSLHCVTLHATGEGLPRKHFLARATDRQTVFSWVEGGEASLRHQSSWVEDDGTTSSSIGVRKNLRHEIRPDGDEGTRRQNPPEGEGMQCG